MVEVELKFQIPVARRTALLKTLDPKKSTQIALKALYFDTPTLDLAQHGVALRQRLEGQQWVQTLKAAGQSHFHSFEHNHPLETTEMQDTPPQLDLQIYQNTPEAQAILQHALGTKFDQLQLQFETDIQRTSRVMTLEDTDIEISLDVGKIRCADSEVEVHEVEFELKQGSIQHLLALSIEWVKKYHLWLDVRNKAEIGHLLSVEQKVRPATLAKEFYFSK